MQGSSKDEINSVRWLGHAVIMQNGHFVKSVYESNVQGLEMVGQLPVN